MENPDYTNLSDQTKAEMELSRKMAAANAAAFALAEKARTDENSPPVETDEAAKAAADAKPLQAAEREPVYPVAKEPYQPKKPGGR